MFRKLLLTLLFSATVAGLTWAQSDTPNAMCPVMRNEPIKKKFHAPWNGKEVYFCCRSCVKRFKKNPEKYAPNLIEPTVPH